MPTPAETADFSTSPPDEPSSRVRWVLLIAFLGLFGLIVANGIKSYHHPPRHAPAGTGGPPGRR
jgi:hypothetical protein